MNEWKTQRLNCREVKGHGVKTARSQLRSTTRLTTTYYHFLPAFVRSDHPLCFALWFHGPAKPIFSCLPVLKYSGICREREYRGRDRTSKRNFICGWKSHIICAFLLRPRRLLKVLPTFAEKTFAAVWRELQLNLATFASLPLKISFLLFSN